MTRSYQRVKRILLVVLACAALAAAGGAPSDHHIRKTVDVGVTSGK
jgi:hypothetical protein